MNRCRGFSLLEVLVAFALMATALVVVLSILSSGMQQIARAERVSEAALHARNVLDNFGRVERIVPGEFSGDLDQRRFVWRANVYEVEDPLDQCDDSAQLIDSDQRARPEVSASTTPVLYQVDIEVSWQQSGQNYHVAVSSIRAAYALEAR